MKPWQLYNHVYACVFVYELCLGNFAAVPFIFIVFIREFIVNKCKTQLKTIIVLTCYGFSNYYLSSRPYLSFTLDNDHT